MGIAERKERELERRRQEILQAALRLFDRDAWQLVTIERIAQEAEIGKGTVYLHFSSKEDICGALALDFLRQLLARLHEIPSHLPVLARLAAAVTTYFEVHRTAQGYHRAVEYCDQPDFRARLGAETLGELDQADAAIRALIHGILEQGIAEGVFADRPLPILLLGAHSTLVGALRLLAGDCHRELDAQQSIEEITRFVLAGLMYQDRVSLPGGDRRNS